MNNITMEILPLILLDKEAWDRVTNKPNTKYIYKQLQMGREALYLDRIYWPRLARFMDLVRAWNILPGEKWERIMVGNVIEIPAWSPTEVDCQELLLERFEVYVERIWRDDPWNYEEPTEEEILSLGIHAPWNQQMSLL